MALRALQQNLHYKSGVAYLLLLLLKTKVQKSIPTVTTWVPTAVATSTAVTMGPMVDISGWLSMKIEIKIHYSWCKKSSPTYISTIVYNAWETNTVSQAYEPQMHVHIFESQLFQNWPNGLNRVNSTSRYSRMGQTGYTGWNSNLQWSQKGQPGYTE